MVLKKVGWRLGAVHSVQSAALQLTKTQVEFESREALLAERRESEEHCKLLLIAQREKSQREEESRWETVCLENG